MFALLDANNFYVSCEKCFQPALRDKPVVVLSANDGCAIARSEEAKALGIKMGEPYFKFKHLELTHGLVTRSACFPLYADLSSRLMSIASGMGCDVEQYSIDEQFIDLSGVRDITRRAWVIRDRIHRGLGIACGVGIGPTKTLAKFANHIAKTSERRPGSYPARLQRVCNLAELSHQELAAALEATPVGEIWGVGPRISAQLYDAGILNALQPSKLDLGTVRRHWSVVMERTVRELNGEPCLTLESQPEPKQMIACTRSFGSPVSELDPLIEAVSDFASRAAQKLRLQGSVAAQIQVFAHTSRFRPPPHFHRSIVVPLIRPTSDTGLIVASAVHGIKRIYREGFELKKAGVILMDLNDKADLQHELDLGDEICDRGSLFAAVDELNKRYGRGTVHIGSTGTHAARTKGAAWATRQERRSPLYTTSLADIPEVRC